jgi:1-acyl-sn-glycerol-3-phosphate acyltransferase
MITAHHKKWAHGLFRPYLFWLFRRHFYACHLLGDEPAIDPDAPVLLLPNHSSWWDGFFVYLLNHCLWQRRIDLMMLEEQLQLHRFFRFLGAFSIQPGDVRQVRPSLAYALEQLQSPRAPLLVVFPQGELLPWGRRPLEYQPGVRWLWQRAPAPALILPLALKIECLAEQRPQAFFLLGKPVPADARPSLEHICRQHEELLLELQQRIEAGERGRPLLLGKRSLHQRRRLWLWRKGAA